MKKLMAIIGVITLAMLSNANAAESSPVPATYIMVCCHGADKGTKFLANGEWDARHDYRDYAFALDQMRKIKEAGINVVGVDFTNPSQWDQFKAHHWPMLLNVVKAAKELDMQYFLFLGNTCAHTMKYWNEKAKIVWEEFAQDPHYRRYGFGDDRPMMTIFLPGKDFAAHLKRSRPEEKNWLEKFRIGTCQVNDPIVPTPTDGWGYRNKSAGSTDLARFVAPNSGVGPGTWARVDAQEWRRRVKWCLGAKEYAVIGTYDDTCDCIFWGIADVCGSRNPTHVHESTKNDPYAYYNIVKEEIAKRHADAAALVSITSGTCAESNPVPQVLWHMEMEVDGVGKPISIESEEQAFEKSQGTFSFGPLKAGERVFYISVTLNVKETPVGKVYTGSRASSRSAPGGTAAGGRSICASATRCRFAPASGGKCPKWSSRRFRATGMTRRNATAPGTIPRIPPSGLPRRTGHGTRSSDPVVCACRGTFRVSARNRGRNQETEPVLLCIHRGGVRFDPRFDRLFVY